MKTFLSTFLAFAITSVVFAQKPDLALARVRYSFSHARDTAQKNKPYTENMILVIGKNASLYTSLDNITNSANMKKMVEEQMKNTAVGQPVNIKINNSGNRSTTKQDLYFFIKENKFFNTERVVSTYLLEDQMPKIDWKFSKDTTSFSGVKCQKATASFKGRNWIAWYAPELPFSSGPWKLNGLPGLIINAYDELNEVKFEFAGLENVKDEPTTQTNGSITSSDGAKAITEGVKIIGLATDVMGKEIKLPTDAIKATRAEVTKLKEAMAKDPQGFINAQMAGSGMAGVTTKVVSAPKGLTLPKPNPINNPIELPEKK